MIATVPLTCKGGIQMYQQKEKIGRLRIKTTECEYKAKNQRLENIHKGQFLTRQWHQK